MSKADETEFEHYPEEHKYSEGTVVSQSVMHGTTEGLDVH